jgi:hypothetical protein
MRGLAQRTIELVMFARELLAENHPMTLRQLHYAIFSAARIPYNNAQNDYKRLSHHTSRARRRYRALELAGEVDQLDSGLLIPPGWIVDEQRQAESVNVFKDLNEYVDAVKSSYRRDYWGSQPVHCEVWCEKATVLGSLRPVKNEWGVTLRPCKGFGSCGQEHEIGDIFEGVTKPILVYYVGDFDPSGAWIDPDIHRRVEVASGRKFRMVRLAIFEADIRRYNLPPQKIKDTDSRAKAFKKKYGANAGTVEVDALPVDVLRGRVEEAVKNQIDWELWNRQVMVEKVELESIVRFADTVRNLPQAEG